ncbi:MAG: hypothetical protein JJT75_01930, partial [Opitutales bacterium]|nr:hypothetical protein [Opitutales bacterium]
AAGLLPLSPVAACCGVTAKDGFTVESIGSTNHKPGPPRAAGTLDCGRPPAAFSSRSPLRRYRQGRLRRRMDKHLLPMGFTP